MHDIRYDEIHDEMYVTNPFAHAVLVFRGGADGEEAPIRYIQGPKTQLGGASRLEVDPVHNEIFVPGGGEILVFDRLANGDVAPKRTIGGPDTQLRNIGGVVVDPVHDLLIAGTQFRGEDNPGGSLVIQAQFMRDDRLGGRWPIFLDLIQLCVTTEGRNHAPGETGRWLEEAGFTDVKYQRMTLLNTNSLLRGYKR